MTARRLQNGSNRIDTPHKLAGELANRYLDFHETIISSCYVIYLDKAAILTVEDIPTNSALKKRSRQRNKKTAHHLYIRQNSHTLMVWLFYQEGRA